MRIRPKFNILNQILRKIGLPFFNSLILLTTLVFSIILVFRSFSLPALKIPKVKITFPKVPRLPKISRFPKPTLPRISFKASFFVSAIILISTWFYFEVISELPSPLSLKDYPNKITTQILDRNGKLLYKIYKDENRTPIKLSDLPLHVKNAFLAAEDKDFYQHKGFSIIGITRAIIKNFKDDRLEGGSTITQQLVKNTLLTNEKTVIRKLKELILAIEVELTYPKDTIFEMYLNQVGFGGPAYGIQEASQQYFGINAKDLSLAQAAFLAGLPQAPSKYSPFGHDPELSKTRQKQVLIQMAKHKLITKDELNQALETKLVFSSKKTEINAPHFVMYVKDLLSLQLGESVVEHGGLIVTTTLDLELQEIAQEAVTEEIKKLKGFQVSNGAALITNPKTGEILAMVGSKDYFNLNEDGQVNLTIATRQPGSSIKPINYALAFENGLSPSSIIEDKPISFSVVGQETWTPKNYDGKFHGNITLRQALASSYNIPSVILLTKNGIDKFGNFAQQMGISTWDQRERFGLSMALGSLEVKMTDMATVYSAFANGGTSTPLKVVLNIKTNTNEKIFTSLCPAPTSISENATARANDRNCNPKKVISSKTAYQISDILSDNLARSPAFGYNSVLNIKEAKVAVKTGTSNDLRDNWTIGYTSNYLVSTWVGNNNNTPMSKVASGITGASPIWSNIMKKIISKNPQPQSLTIPEGLVKVPICSLTGTLPCAGCPTKIELFDKGQEPKFHCTPEQINRILNPSPTP